jgi:ribosomal protein S18 acetylase RimI-like enzyme
MLQRVRPLDALPRNFDVFVDEIAGGLQTLYGAPAADSYRRKARRSFSASIAHPQMELVGLRRGADCLGIALLQYRNGFGEIPFMHVLHEHAEGDTAERLISEAVKRLRRRKVKGIVAEFVPFFPGALAPFFADRDFEVLPRELMRVALRDGAPVCTQDTPGSRPLRPGEFGEAAACIVDSYRNHPGRRLHLEVHDLEGARDFLQRVVAGSYGTTRPDYLRSRWQLDACVGAALGCEVSPGCGFLLQLIVRQEVWGQGIGTTLVKDLATVFHERSMDQMLLGVTSNNPARRLYERLGFETLLPVNAYVWWQA